MIKFILGVVVGVVISTIGFSGIAHIASKAAPVVDTQVSHAQAYLKEQSK